MVAVREAVERTLRAVVVMTRSLMENLVEEEEEEEDWEEDDDPLPVAIIYPIPLI